MDQQQPMLLRRDITEEFRSAALASTMVAWDIETSGLDWKTERIGTCQIYCEQGGTAVVQLGGDVPARLRTLLEDPKVTKVFHHAPFDLRFMAAHWKARPASIACTKIASKLLDPGRPNEAHSLAPLVREYLAVDVDKSEQCSDWLAGSLTARQVDYAMKDVIYLIPLLRVLMRELQRRNREGLAQACFHHIPARVELELWGYGDVYAY